VWVVRAHPNGCWLWACTWGPSSQSILCVELESSVEALGRRIGADACLLLRTVAPLGEHNFEMYEHSLRVCLLATSLAAHANSVLGDRCIDLHLAFLGGAWHDIGKLDVPNSVLRAKDFGTKERRAVRRHVSTGFARVALAGYYHVAEVVGLHHAFQADPYGLDPRFCSPVVVGTAKVVAVCDFFDALTTRTDGPFAPEERARSRETVARSFPGSEQWAAWLASTRTGGRAVA